jgi:phage-related protein (TIGR01555 family)
MLTALGRLWRYAFPAPETPVVEDAGDRLFSTHFGVRGAPPAEAVRRHINDRLKAALPRPVAAEGVAQDEFDLTEGGLGDLGPVSMAEALFAWFGLQTFIGHQMCAIIAQHWLIDRVCYLPGRDAVKNGFDISIPDQTDEATAKITERVFELDVEFGLKRQMQDFVGKGRVFGIRIALFRLKDAGPDYYENPFNPDAVTPGSYEGFVQIDPYWITPLLDAEGMRDPASPTFYEPTWWMIQGKKYHKSHLIIFRTGEVPDLLKPSYLYGGVPIPQKIMERVYAAERTANEAPQLAMTKRLGVWKTDLGHILANQDKFAVHMDNFMKFRDNYGQRIIDSDDEMDQHDTTLTHLDVIIDGQYDLVAAAGGVPITKLFSKSPKGGLNNSGNYEEASYHEELKTLQEEDLSPLVARHHLMVGRSIVAEEFKIDPKALKIRHTWSPLNAPTAKELAETNKLKAETDNQLVAAGAIDGEDVRNRLRTDKTSGYHGISPDVPEPDVDEEAEADADEKKA